MTQDPLDDAIEFVESVSSPPEITINKRIMLERIQNITGRPQSMKMLRATIDYENQVAIAGYFPSGHFITFFKHFKKRDWKRYKDY